MSNPNSKKSIVFMWLLTVANLITFYYQPSDFSIFDHVTDKWAGLGKLLMTPVVFVYAVLVIAGMISLIKTLYPILVGEKCSTLTKVTVTVVSVSLLAVGYGTFLQKQSFADLHETMEIGRRSAKWDQENVLLKYGGGRRLYRSASVWRGDTIIYNTGYYDGGKIQIDTLVVNEASNTCHWTYKPMVDYRIEYFGKDRFTQDAASASLPPMKYEERMQYVINNMNNKDKNEYYYVKGADETVKNDTIMCFLFQTSKHDATRRLGYLYFAIEHGMAVLKDSCSDIYRLIDYPKEKDYRVRAWWAYQSERDLPLLRSCYRKEKLINDDFIQYSDYFDVLQKKPTITNFPTWVEYWNSTTESLVYIETKIESQRKANDYDYPIFDYRTEFRASKHSLDPADTLEIGRLVMSDGKYVKEVQMKKE